MKINRKNLYLFLTLAGLVVWTAHLWRNNFSKNENYTVYQYKQMEKNLSDTKIRYLFQKEDIMNNIEEIAFSLKDRYDSTCFKQSVQLDSICKLGFSKINALRQKLLNAANATNINNLKLDELANKDLANNILFEKNNGKTLAYDLVESLLEYKKQLILVADTSQLSNLENWTIIPYLIDPKTSIDQLSEAELQNLADKMFDNFNLVEIFCELTALEYRLASLNLSLIGIQRTKIGDYCYYFTPICLHKACIRSYPTSSMTNFNYRIGVSDYGREGQWNVKSIYYNQQNPVLKGKNEFSLEFTAQSDTFNEFGYANKKLHFSYELSRIRTKKIIPAEIDYIVTQPVINITSKQKAYFYEACANEFSMRVPSLGDEYLPEIKAENAKIVKIDDKGKVFVSPNGQTTKLSITNNGVELANLVYPVKKTPAPQIEILSNNRPLDWKNGGMIPQKISVKISSEANFQKEFPRDAQYFPSQIVVSLYRKGKNMYSSTFQAEKINLQTFEKKAENGDYLIFEINECLRKNFQSEMRLEKFETKSFVWAVL